MRNGATGKHRESGLSEVIGFVLIIGLIVVIASLYLTYGVPAQGRENEILHMNLIKDQFVSYKIGLDSLFTNNKVGTTVSNSFSLGTSGGYTQGAFSFIPIMSPINSGGVMAINQRTLDPETLSVQSQSLVLNNTVYNTQDLPGYANYTPTHMYVNISGITNNELNEPSDIFGVTVNTTQWSARINLIPQVSFYQSYQACVPAGPCAGCPGASKNGTPIDLTTSCLVPINNYNVTQSDLTISITKGSIDTMQNYPVYEKVVPGTTYTIDLMEDAYGIRSVITPPQNITLNMDKPLGPISATGNITYNFAEMSPYSSSPIPLGSIEYRAQNNYWIPQDYYYQMGGVFLQQGDGNTTYKLPPEISFSYVHDDDPAKRIVTVNINALTIDKNNRGVVGGNSPVQIKSTLTNITPFPYVPGKTNTKWIQIGVNTTDPQARMMWKNYFNYTAQVAGIPASDYTVDILPGGTEAYIRLAGNSTSAEVYDINVIASNATYSTTIHGVGGIVQ